MTILARHVPLGTGFFGFEIVLLNFFPSDGVYGLGFCARGGEGDMACLFFFWGP